MKLTKLHLTNYRGAKDLSINLHPKLNVFTGVNGSGKTTVLDGAVLMLAQIVKCIKTTKDFKGVILETSITNQQDFALIEASIDSQDGILEYSLRKSRFKKSNKTSGDLAQIKQYAESIRAQLKQHQPTNLTLFVYYPVNRITVAPIFQAKCSSSPLAAYDNALGSKANFRDFLNWIQKSSCLDSQLELICQAIQQILPNFTGLRLGWKQIEVIKDCQVLRFDQLSEGEKCLIAMIGDLVRRLAMLNPDHLQPLTASAIVLIDEIELHLHPQWQHTIIPVLLNIFPNCQFLITTNSPHIVTHVQPENLQILKQTETGIQVNFASESYGKTTERILGDLMGLTTTRPVEIEQSLQEIYRCVDKTELASAKQKLSQLRKNIKSTTDPELTRLELMIRRKEANKLFKEVSNVN